MEDIRKKALEISAKFQFSEFQLAATAENGSVDPSGTIAACENHLDTGFMSMLEQGAHLDLNRMPL